MRGGRRKTRREGGEGEKEGVMEMRGGKRKTRREGEGEVRDVREG